MVHRRVRIAHRIILNESLDIATQHVFVMSQFNPIPPNFIELDAIVCALISRGLADSRSITTDPTITQPGSPTGAAGTFSNVSSTTYYPGPFANWSVTELPPTAGGPSASGANVGVGAVVGAAVGALLVGLVIAAGIWAICRRRRKRREENDKWPKVEKGPDFVAGAPYRSGGTIDEDDEPKNNGVVSVAPYALPRLDIDRIEPAPRVTSPEMSYLPQRTQTLRSSGGPPSPGDSTGPLVQRSTTSSITEHLGSGSYNRHLAPSLSVQGLPRRDGADQWYAGSKADAGAPTPLSPSVPGGGFFAMGTGDVKADPPADTHRTHNPASSGAPVASGSGAAAVVRSPTPQAPVAPDDERDPGQGTVVPEDAPPEFVLAVIARSDASQVRARLLISVQLYSSVRRACAAIRLSRTREIDLRFLTRRDEHAWRAVSRRHAGRHHSLTGAPSSRESNPAERVHRLPPTL